MVFVVIVLPLYWLMLSTIPKDGAIFVIKIYHLYVLLEQDQGPRRWKLLLNFWTAFVDNILHGISVVFSVWYAWHNCCIYSWYYLYVLNNFLLIMLVFGWVLFLGEGVYHFGEGKQNWVFLFLIEKNITVFVYTQVQSCTSVKLLKITYLPKSARKLSCPHHSSF